MSRANRAKREPSSASPPATGRRLGRNQLGVVAALVLAAAALVAGLALRGHDGGNTGLVGAQSIGLQTGKAPWATAVGDLTARLEKTGVPFSDMQSTHLHMHPQLRIHVQGRPVEVPANIGITPSGRSMAALHTHDNSGMIHVESAVVRAYTLGAFFDVWGVRLTKQCLGGYCTTARNALAALVDGKPYAADPRTIRFADGKEITLAYGTTAEIAKASG